MKKPARKSATDKSRSLLFEIGTEELPPKALARLGKTLAKSVLDGLVENRLVSAKTPDYEWFASPRRLAVLVREVHGKQPNQIVERRGPPITAAFDGSGNPTPAASGFARSCNTSVEKLQRLQNDKGAWLMFQQNQRGLTAKRLLPTIVENALKALPIPKRMRWGDGDAEFVRPAHWVVLMYGSEVVKCKLLGLTTGQTTQGHRFHSNRPLTIANADSYAKLLKEKGSVIASFTEREALIRSQISKLGTKVKGKVVASKTLLNEVTALVELPYSLIGEFDKEFLKVPPEALISSMTDHQKYFHLTNTRGKLLPYFITVSNIKSKSAKRIRDGNERVLRARLADARFFWDSDRKTPLIDRLEALKGVLFHRKLGSVYDKSQRLSQLTDLLAAAAGADVAQTTRVALLAKADLVTDMVGEFPDLQGIMGKYYAAHDGEGEAVAAAVEEHYRPRYAGDTLPTTVSGQIVSVADKLDSLLGIFAAGEIPTGDKDPYALRRQALGILRILIEAPLDIDLALALEFAVDTFKTTLSDKDSIDLSNATTDKVIEFIFDRLRAYYFDKGIPADAFSAVRALGTTRPLDFDKRIKAVTAFRKLDAATTLCAANKRIRNILRQANHVQEQKVDAGLLYDFSEQNLAAEVDALTLATRPMIEAGSYQDALAQLAKLKAPIDEFFDRVMVMDENLALRENRLALLDRVNRLFLEIADISKLQIK
ncbi:glycine--tRNA ligase subunit beta [Pseudomonadota bacterium]